MCVYVCVLPRRFECCVSVGFRLRVRWAWKVWNFSILFSSAWDLIFVLRISLPGVFDWWTLVVLDFIEIVASELVGGWKGNKVFDEDYCWREGGYLYCCQCFGSWGRNVCRQMTKFWVLKNPTSITALGLLNREEANSGRQWWEYVRRI